jgi:hypothetical protein
MERPLEESRSVGDRAAQAQKEKYQVKSKKGRDKEEVEQAKRIEIGSK